MQELSQYRTSAIEELNMLKISNGSAAQSVLIIENLTENLLTKYLLRTKSGYLENPNFEVSNSV